MPTTLSRYNTPRARAAGLTANQVMRLVKKAMEVKKKYQSSSSSSSSKPRKTRSDKGKPRKGKANPYTKRPIRNVTSGVHTYTKMAPKTYKFKEMARKFPQVLSQTFYITSPESYTELNPGIDGTLTNPDMLYSVPSVLWTNSSIHLFNVHNTENLWYPDPAGVGPNGYRTGTQLTNEPSDTQLGTKSTFQNDSFIFVNDPTNVRLTSVQSPFKQNGLAENAVGAYSGGGNKYTIPNSSLQSLSIKLKVGNPTIQDEYITLKVIRLNDGDTTLEPGTLGDDNTQRQNLTQTMCNSGKFTNPQQFSTIYSKRFRMPGIKTGGKLKMYSINKDLSLNYLRSNYRKQYNANNLTSIGLDAMPSYTISDDNTFFNAVFVVLQSNCIDDQYIADVNVEKGDTSVPQYYERMPQVASYPPVGIPLTAEGGKYKTIATGAQHCVSGSIQVVHRVQAKRRAIGSTTQESLNALQSQIVALEENNKKKDKALKIYRGECSDDENSS